MLGITTVQNVAPPFSFICSVTSFKVTRKKNNKVPRLTKLTAGFGNTYHRPALKVVVLVSLLMRVQFVCSVFLSGFPNMSIVFVRES